MIVARSRNKGARIKRLAKFACKIVVSFIKCASVNAKIYLLAKYCVVYR